MLLTELDVFLTPISILFVDKNDWTLVTYAFSVVTENPFWPKKVFPDFATSNSICLYSPGFKITLDCSNDSLEKIVLRNMILLF